MTNREILLSLGRGRVALRGGPAFIVLGPMTRAREVRPTVAWGRVQILEGGGVRAVLTGGVLSTSEATQIEQRAAAGEFKSPAIQRRRWLQLLAAATDAAARVPAD